MSKKGGLGKMLAGVGIGVGLGMLFAPKKGSETRADLKKAFDKLVNDIKNIDAEDVKKELEEKIDSLKKELEDLDKEKVLKIAKTKVKELQEKADQLVAIAKKKATPVIEQAANQMRQKVIDVTKDILEKLEKDQEKQA